MTDHRAIVEQLREELDHAEIYAPHGTFWPANRQELRCLLTRLDALERVAEAAQWREDTLDVIYENGRSENAYREGLASHANANRDLRAALVALEVK